MAKRSNQYEEFRGTPSRRKSRSNQRNVHRLDSFELSKLTPMTLNQNKFFEDFDNGFNILAIGSAGTGKTFCALYLALQKLITNGIEKIIIVRSATPIRNQGFLPGTLEEKEEIYNLPYRQIVNDLFKNDTAWEVLVKRGYIQFISTSYIRGLTFKNSVVVFDEMQNTDIDECYSLLTRMGDNCRLILCGDYKQNDLKRKRESTSFNWLLKVIKLVPDYFKVVDFDVEDIVRGDMVKKIIIAAEKVDNEFYPS